MVEKLFDLQGHPIKVGSLVACLTNGSWTSGLAKRRVAKLHSVDRLSVEGGGVVHPWQCVVLEEPVWPN